MKHCWPFLMVMALFVTPVSARPVTGNIPAKIDSTVQAMYGPDSKIVSTRWFGPFRERGDAGRSVEDLQVNAALDVIKSIRWDEDPVWFGSTSPMRLDPAYSKRSVTLDDLFQQDLRYRRANYMNQRTGNRGLLATAQDLGMDKPGAYLVIVQRPPGMPSKVPGREPPPQREVRVPIMITGPVTEWTIEPFAGYSVLGTDGANYGTPIIGMRFTRHRPESEVSLRGYEGRRFDEDGDNQVWGAEVQVGPSDGLSFLFGAEGNWRLDRTYHYNDRFVMCHVGLALGFSLDRLHGEVRGALGIGNFDSYTENTTQPGGGLSVRLGYRL